MGYVISVIVSVVAGVMVFIIQSMLKDNKRLREGRKEEERGRYSERFSVPFKDSTH